MTAIRMRNVVKTFNDVRVIDKLSLDIEDGEFCVFVGPSGCGKSTLLRLLAGLEELSSGEIYIGDQRVDLLPPSERGVAMVFQSYALYPHMNVYNNMAFGLKLSKNDSRSAHQRVQEAAEMLQLTPLLDRLPKDLSGGQRQRVAIGRAIVRDSQVFLFDEPLSNLDAALRVQTRIEIAKLHRKLPASMVYVTHDQMEAMTLADKIVLLNADKAGSVAQVGAPLDLYHHPQNLFVAGFIGSPRMNLLPCTLESATPALAHLRLPNNRPLSAQVAVDGAKAGTPMTLGIRPEHLRIGGAEPHTVAGQVQYLEHLGNTSYSYLEVDGLQDHLVVRGSRTVPRGEILRVNLPPQHCHLFDSAGRAFKRVLHGTTPALFTTPKH